MMRILKTDMAIVSSGIVLAVSFVYPKLLIAVLALAFITIPPVLIISFMRGRKTKGITPPSSQTPSNTNTSTTAKGGFGKQLLYGSLLAIIITVFMFAFLDNESTAANILFGTVFYGLPTFFAVSLIPAIQNRIYGHYAQAQFPVVSFIINACLIAFIDYSLLRDAQEGPGEIGLLVFFVPILAPLTFAWSVAGSRIAYRLVKP